MLNLNDLYYFVQAVDAGGFAAASRRLGMPKSSISKRVAELETALDVRLIHRSPRSFVLSEVGRDFYEHARAALIEAESAEATVLHRTAEPRGRVRITASVPTAQFNLAACLPDFALAHPKIDLQVHATDRFIDIVQEGFDIALRSHFSPLPDSELVQRRLAVEPVFMIASEGYLSSRSMPSAPQELAAHDAILIDQSRTEWTLHSRAGKTISVSPSVRMMADETQVLLSACIAGLGIVCLPRSFCADALADGRVRRVLPDWQAGSVTTTAVMTHRRGQLPAVRTVVDFLARHLADPPG